MQTFEEIAQATGLTVGELRAVQSGIAKVQLAYSLPPGSAVRLLNGGAAGTDMRTNQWTARLRIFDGADVCLGDSDEGAPVDAPGAEIVNGFGGAYAWACELVAHFQPQANIKTLLAELERRGNTLRVAVSRGGGRGRITAPYPSNGTLYFARLDVTRAGDNA